MIDDNDDIVCRNCGEASSETCTCIHCQWCGVVVERVELVDGEVFCEECNPTTSTHTQ